MKKKIIQTVFFTLCILFCLSVGISSFFSSADAQLERREVADMPEFVYGDATWGERLNEALTSRTPFRAAALTAKTLLLEKVFHTSAVEQVILGSDGWLYFNDTTADYLGTEPLSAQEITQIVDTLQRMNAYCNEQSAKFIFTVAPNKNTLYPAHMPPRYLRGDDSNYDRLTDALRGTDIPFVDFHSLPQNSAEPLYYRTDTHWNAEGALIAYNTLMDALELPHADYRDTPRVNGEKVGDLELMLHPTRPRAETERVPDYAFSYSYIGRLRSEEDITIQTVNSDGSGSLLMFRDSFGNALLPLLAEHFNAAYFSRAVPIDLSLIESQQADTVIYEIAERNLRNIIDYPPIIP